MSSCTQGIHPCFVVMPFGKKPLRDGSGGSFDFDKVYRVIIRRAVQDAGLHPFRADEQLGSKIIHMDMFKALRDHAVVLADLSLENPNVFYELGIRHVMSPRGTVLMCRRGHDLPFDIKLSRVIFYDYDGVSLDWEEAERVAIDLRNALEEAKKGKPDSPVYALLDRVLTEEARDGDLRAPAFGTRPSAETARTLERYHRLVADFWFRPEQCLQKLRKEFGRDVFGARALGHLCLLQEPPPPEANVIARDLYDLEQYDLANKIYLVLEKQGRLTARELLRLGSSLSEEHTTIRGAHQALDYAEHVQRKMREQNGPAHAKCADDPSLFEINSYISSIRFWMWGMTQAAEDLQAAIDFMKSALEAAAILDREGIELPVGRVAQAHLKLMMMLRAEGGNREREDIEHHGASILAIRATERTPVHEASYLRWYQAITLADTGQETECRKLAIAALREDAKQSVGDRFDAIGNAIGNRQYSQLRRFIENNARWLRNLRMVGEISQMLQSGHATST